jgi:hypothetical protein
VDTERFDDLAKTLAASTSRRTILKSLAAAGVAALLGRSSARAQAGSTVLKLTNTSGKDVTTYLTLGAVAGCVQDIHQISFVTNPVPGNNLQGSFNLAAGQTITYNFPNGCVSGNFSFGTPPINCPTSQFPNGVNIAEFILNNTQQPGNPQETLDNSAVAGVNADVRYAMSGGGPWNGGPSHPNITGFENKDLRSNGNIVGVFPWGCTNCVDRAGAPTCQNYEGTCNADHICNVQRDASSGGGTVEIFFQGFIGPSSGAPTSSAPTATPTATATGGTAAGVTSGSSGTSGSSNPPTCGTLGQACCAGSACNSPNTICSGGICVACGGNRQMCCPGNICQSGPCNNGICADPTPGNCGGVGQPCCIPGNTCDDAGLTCISQLCVPLPRP